MYIDEGAARAGAAAATAAFRDARASRASDTALTSLAGRTVRATSATASKSHVVRRHGGTRGDETNRPSGRSRASHLFANQVPSSPSRRRTPTVLTVRMRRPHHARWMPEGSASCSSHGSGDRHRRCSQSRRIPLRSAGRRSGFLTARRGPESWPRRRTSWPHRSDRGAGALVQQRHDETATLIPSGWPIAIRLRLTHLLLVEAKGPNDGQAARRRPSLDEIEILDRSRRDRAACERPVTARTIKRGSTPRRRWQQRLRRGRRRAAAPCPRRRSPAQRRRR